MYFVASPQNKNEQKEVFHDMNLKVWRNFYLNVIKISSIFVEETFCNFFSHNLHRYNKKITNKIYRNAFSVYISCFVFSWLAGQYKNRFILFRVGWLISKLELHSSLHSNKVKWKASKAKKTLMCRCRMLDLSRLLF